MASPEVSPGMVRRVQTALQQQGTYNGAIDGLWGPATQSALQNFQQSHGLRATGELNTPTLTALNLQPAAPAPAPVTNPPPAPTSSAAPAAPPVTTSSTAPASP
jgi:peptidoglycan hydrolase-like protein with peptidoglycan-binding domain